MVGEFNQPEGDISAVSNELEFFLAGTDATTVLEENSNELELSHEVNRVNTIELMVSMAPDVDVLNSLAGGYIGELSRLVHDLGGEIYAGSALMEDTSGLDPSWYRTTSLSRQLARGFLSIGSQQLVIGVAREGSGNKPGEQFGIELYNFLRQLTPLIHGLVGTSPYEYVDGELVDSGYESHRPARYQEMSARLPESMFATPVVWSVDDYQNHIQRASDDVNRYLAEGRLDTNETELYRNRQGTAYAPFETLAPHQIYSWVRLRTDHANEDSIFSLEIRATDLSSRIETIQALNSFILGLAYYAARYGFCDLQESMSTLRLQHRDMSPLLLAVARDGMDTQVGRTGNRGRLRDMVPNLLRYATLGLQYHESDPCPMQTEILRILNEGTDAQIIRGFVESGSTTPADLRSFLISRFDASLDRTRV